MNTTNKVSSWKYVEITKRDEQFLKTIGEEGFLRRDLVIKYIFRGNVSYAKIRIRKLKKFGYLKAVSIKVGDPECYLLGPKGVEVAARFYPLARLRLGWPKGLSIQESIDFATYDHKCKVAEVRLIFESLGLCKNWESERRLRAGVKGGCKVPDGFFTRNDKGIAVEVELNPKKPATYRKIFEFYENDPKIHYVFYVCGSLPLMMRIRRFLKKTYVSKGYCFMLYNELVKLKDNAPVRIKDGEFLLKEVIK